MKKLPLLFLFAFYFSFLNSYAQNPTYQQKLFYTCKVWGFVKYFHSRVSVCEVNWDSVLIATLPSVKSAVTDSEFNDALDTMLKAAGPMALATSPPYTVPPELSRNLNFGWINNAILRADVQTTLDTIKNNFRPHAECWVEINNPPSPTHGGYLWFGPDSLILNINDNSNYPDEWHRLLELFASWNIINYFNPYNYILNQPWDSSLYQNMINIDVASNDKAFFTAFRELTSNLDDWHVYAETGDYYCDAPVNGFYSPNFFLKYIQGKYVVVNSGITGLTNGDEIISINGLTTKQWEDSLGPYLSAGDSAAFYELMETNMILYAPFSTMTISYYDSLNNIQTISTKCTSYLPQYYPNDTLANVQWRYWSNCNIGYVNVGKMQDVDSDVSTMYSVLQNTNAIIFDIRNYPASDAVSNLINNYLAPIGSTYCAKYMNPDIEYPGTYSWVYQSFYPGNSNPYAGKIIVLYNEQTFSAAEYASMCLGELPNSVKIGSQTVGTDGDISYFFLSQYMTTGFTSMGWFYPNGDSTERVGIIPDILVYPSQEGIRQGRDEILEKALDVAGCPLAVPTIKAPQPYVQVYPNPNNGVFTVAFGHAELVSASQTIIEVYNMLGEQVLTETLRPALGGTQGDNSIDLSSQPNGVYFYRVLNENGNLEGEGKIVIEK